MKNSLLLPGGIATCLSLFSVVCLGDVGHAQMVNMSSSANTYLVPYGFETQMGYPSPWENFDASNRSSSTSSYSTANQPFNGNRRQLIHWSGWGSSSYSDGDDICRENNSNVVCLTPTSASHLRW
jgi:hypothetical protein